MAPHVTAIVVLAIGLAHLFIVARAIPNLDSLIQIAIERAPSTRDPATAWPYWRLLAGISLSWLAVIGATATVCGVGLLRQSRAARRVWVAAAILVVPFYSVGSVRYIRLGFIDCAIGAGFVAAITLGTAIYLLTPPGSAVIRH